MKNVDKIKYIIFISLVFLIAGCNFINSVFKCNDNNYENTFSYISIVSPFKSRVTEKDYEILLDSSLNKEEPPYNIIWAQYEKIISHEKYIKLQSELDRIKRNNWVYSDSLHIYIAVYENGNFVRDYKFFSDYQVFEFIAMMHDLLGKDGYVTIERYLTKKRK
jgi:hypothetical protein